MTKVTINKPGESAPESDSPSQQLIKQATQSTVVTDSSGRRITLRNPGPLAQFRLIEAVGESSSNRVYLAMVMPLIYVAAIDDSPVPGISNKSQLEALIQRLDNHGLEAVTNGIQENFAPPSSPEQSKETIKNS